MVQVLSPPRPKRLYHRYIRGRCPTILTALLAVFFLTKLSPQPAASPAADRFTNGTLDNDVVFECPDGRFGLHVVHSRFLIGQAKANPVFAASRMHLARTFLVPNLNAQTSQRFVLYVAHDPRLPAATLTALRAVLHPLRIRALTGSETSIPTPDIPIQTILKSLGKTDPRVSHIDLLVTSRLDLDDLAHVGAAAAVQNAACAAPRPAAAKGLAVKLVYMDKGMLWYPSPDHAYGRSCLWVKHNYVPHLAIMQSMVMIAGTKGRHLLTTCGVNCYSYPHYKPAKLEEIELPRGCGAKLEFSAAEDVFRWKPPGEGSGVGCLYSKTASSWSFGKLQHRGIECKAAVAAEVAALFGAGAQQLASVNALMAGLEQGAPELVANNTNQKLE